MQCYYVTLPLNSDNRCALSSLDHQPKHKTPKTGSRLPAMKKAEKGSPSGLPESQPKTPFVFVQCASCAFQT